MLEQADKRSSGEATRRRTDGPRPGRDVAMPWVRSEPRAMSPSLAEVRAWDAADPLRAWRGRFDLPQGVIYLDGNSLGAAPRGVHERLRAAMADEWATSLIRSWNRHDWIGAPARIGGKIARLVGARPGEVIVADSTSVNLFKLIVAALAARPGRRTLLTEPGNFPTDLYIA